MLHLSKFSNYIDEIKKLEDEKNEIIEKSNLEFQSSVKNEISKHLELINYKDNDIFLIDTDFGILVSKAKYRPYNNVIFLIIKTVYINKNGNWISNNDKFLVEYSTDNKKDIDEFILDYIKKLKVYNIKRKSDKEKRQFRKDIKKYNL